MLFQGHVEVFGLGLIPTCMLSILVLGQSKWGVCPGFNWVAASAWWDQSPKLVVTLVGIPSFQNMFILSFNSTVWRDEAPHLLIIFRSSSKKKKMRSKIRSLTCLVKSAANAFYQMDIQIALKKFYRGTILAKWSFLMRILTTLNTRHNK